MDEKGSSPPATGLLRDERRFFVDASAVGKPPPPRQPPPVARDAGGAPSAVITWPPAAPEPPRPLAPAERAAPAPPPVTSPAPPSRPRKRRRLRWPRWRKRVWLALFLTPLLVVLVLAVVAWRLADSKFSEVERVPVGHLLDRPGDNGTNILVVGSDTRSGVDPNVPNAEGILGDEAPSGQRSDTMMLLHLGGAAGPLVTSIPRDLMVTFPDTGERGRVNAAFNSELGGGPERLIRTVRDNLQVPIHRYMEIDFVAFAGLVDALGGITVDFPNPAFDDHTGLYVTEAGPQVLDGDQALAYVRSRHYTEVLPDGSKVEDPTADIGRTMRQQVFLQTVMGKIADSKNPLTLYRVAGKVADAVRIDDELSLWEAMKLGWSLRGVDLQPAPMPVVLNRDGASLRLDETQADAFLAQFR